MTFRDDKKLKQNIIEKFSNTNSTSAIYSLIHLIIAFFALYLSYQCNNGFDLLSFLIAFCCPYCYIVYALAIKGCLSNQSL
jgi:hypothetical protein